MNELTVIALTLDGKPHSVPAGSSLAALVDSLGHAPNKVSTAVNGMFVARGQRGSCVLQEGDAVLLFQPIVGG
ncbi:sulfur carrier protein ThiS [Caenimonas terrae]|uniref:Sulfur carrier protein ThiS n=1 Tax=Caenimonas terrae TaxID=696074 RepID=A0ABW0NI95_9BURK